MLPRSAVRDIPDLDNDPFDPQLGVIIDLLTPRLNGLEKSDEPISFVTYQVLARERAHGSTRPTHRLSLRADVHDCARSSRQLHQRDY
jgi:hypothetical protein